MSRMNADALRADLAKVVDPTFADLVVTTYLEMQQRYFVEDWQPTELDGGRFCEAVARAIYQIDSGNISHSKLPGAVAEYMLDTDKSGKPLSVPHTHALDVKDRNHFCKVLQTVYKFRSDRGAVHISPQYTANHLDAAMIVANVKWLFAEFLRLSWKKDRNEIAVLIEAILEFEHPLIHVLDGEPLVLSESLSAPEEVLILLRREGERGLTREHLRHFVKASQPAVDMAIHRLVEGRQIRMSKQEEFVITHLGAQRVLNDIMPKLSASDDRATGSKRNTHTSTHRPRKSARSKRA